MESIIVEVTSQRDFCEVVDDSVRFFAEEKCESLDCSKIEKVDQLETCVKVKEKEINERFKEKETSEKLEETQDKSSMVSDESLIEKPFKQEEEGKVLSPIPEDHLLKEPKYDGNKEETEGTKPVKKSKKDRRKVMQVEKEDRKLVRESSMISVVDTMIKTSNEYSDQFALKSEEKFPREKPRVATSIEDDVFFDEKQPTNQMPPFSTIERPPPIGASEGTDVVRSSKKEKKKKSKKKRKSREESKQKVAKTPDKNTNNNSNNSPVQISDSSMLMSEYIEGMLTGLSPEENKILQQLQQNRKKTLQRANNAATLIQNNWKKYKLRKTPPRVEPEEPEIVEEASFSSPLQLPHQAEEIIVEETPSNHVTDEEEVRRKEERRREKEERRRRLGEKRKDGGRRRNVGGG